ncbi:unnamed protein product [Sympodiomycopsis kandeliae]
MRGSLSLRPAAALARGAPISSPTARRLGNVPSAIAAPTCQSLKALQSRAFQTTRSALSEDGSIRKTVLHEFHVTNGGKMVSFGGYSMPLTYSSLGQSASHHHTREAASLFDVSHMVQHYFEAAGAGKFLEWLTPSSLASLPNHQGTLSVLLNHGGGILDDTVITKIDDQKFYVVTNAGRRKEDLAWISERLADWKGKGDGGEVKHTILEDQGLVALQGPKSVEVLSQHTDADLTQLTFGKSVYATIADVQGCHIARGGYTGEDGFEISIPPNETVKVTDALLNTAPTALAGLAARDSLRLEAGMCLYGHDLDESVGPAEAGLTWVVAKDRREKGDFIGAERVLKEIKEGPKRRRVGLVVDGAPAREGAQLFDPSTGESVGAVTSGIPSPTLGKNIAMAYVANGHHKKGTQLEVQVRGKKRVAEVVKMPFVENKFFRG